MPHTVWMASGRSTTTPVKAWANGCGYSVTAAATRRRPGRRRGCSRGGRTSTRRAGRPRGARRGARAGSEERACAGSTGAAWVAWLVTSDASRRDRRALQALAVLGAPLGRAWMLRGHGAGRARFARARCGRLIERRGGREVRGGPAGRMGGRVRWARPRRRTSGTPGDVAAYELARRRWRGRRATSQVPPCAGRRA